MMSSYLPPPHVRAWYCYAFAVEVFSACALAIFLPITLEQMAREIGYYAPDLSEHCVSNQRQESGVAERACKARILGVWVDTASFSMYVKSIAVAFQAICIISIGPLADSPYWRKRLLITFAYIGSFSGICFLFFPSANCSWVPIVAALLNIVGNTTYATSIVCCNAFLPELAREDEAVRRARSDAVQSVGNVAGALNDILDEEEADGEESHLLPDHLAPVLLSVSTLDLALSDPIKTGDTETAYANKSYDDILSLTISRLSSVGTAIGFLSGVSVLALLLIPVMILGGTTFSLRLAVGISGIWWAVFTVLCCLGLPSGDREQTLGPRGIDIKEAWYTIGRMVAPKQIKQMSNLYTFLLAWMFLSDGFHTTTYAAIIYASSVLSMSASKVALIGIFVQSSAVVSSVFVPRIQRWLSGKSVKPVTNHQVLIAGVIAAALIPLYASLGLVLPFGGLKTEGEMYVLAVWFGLVFGPFLSYSRAVYAELIPHGHESTFFSLFAFTDKSASFIGPAAVGLIADLTGNLRFGFLFLLVMLVFPIPVLMRVSMKQGKVQARMWSEVKAGEERE